MIFDTHAHYDDEQFDADREALLSGMKAGGVGMIVDAAATVASWDKILELTEKYPFDFVIFSCHQVENKEYWRQEPQEGKTQLEYNRRYYQEILDVVKVYKDYSILGHLDVIKRYDKQGEIEFEKIQDLIEQIFEVVIADGKGIELNTSSRAYKLKSLMPSKEILKLYHDMGGKIITIGSDAHNADRIGDCVMESQKILKDIGF